MVPVGTSGPPGGAVWLIHSGSGVAISPSPPSVITIESTHHESVRIQMIAIADSSC